MITADELHALVIGTAETLCPWPPRHPMSKDYQDPIRYEFHYYVAGRALGFLALIAGAAAAIRLIRRPPA